jgi:hypothetical protein
MVVRVTVINGLSFENILVQDLMHSNKFDIAAP